ncbi:MAG: hypothetical protein R3C71_06335 [Candidatus Krumholzibacteriia bacterium]
MAKFLTIFNLVAGTASIGGLLVALSVEQFQAAMWILFAFVFSMSAYVLLVPTNPLERNVRAKLERYRHPDGSGAVTIQRGKLTIRSFEPVGVEFCVPFAEPPEVELISNRKASHSPPEITSVFRHQAVFQYSVSAPGDPQEFSWVARGVVLLRDPA